MSKSVAIVGAGVAGLSAAIQLKAKGFDVCVYEKEEKTGGKMNQIDEEGFKFDVGPTIVMMPHIYREVFELAGKNPDDYIPMKKLDPIYNLTYSDGKTVDVSTELTDLTLELEKVSEEDTKGYLKYLADIYERYLVAKDHFIEKSFRSPKDFYNPKTLYQAMKLKTFDSAYHSISKYVKDDRLRKMLSFQTLYIGISPYNGPSIYTIIPMIEMLYGVWYIDGGMYSMVKGMQSLATEMEIPIHTNQKVDEIVIKENKVTGLRFNDTVKEYDLVLCNADFPYAMKDLIADSSNKGKYKDEKIDKMDYSCSCMLLYLGINKELEDMQVHNILFANDFDKNINDIFEGNLPEDPSMYFYCPSKLDDSLAPEGHSSLYVLIPVPSLDKSKFEWDEETIKSYKNKLFDRIKQMKTLGDIRDNIVYEKVYTPKDFEKRFNAYNGATFGLAPTLMQSNYYRPHNKFSKVEGLYFAGSSVHPGAGVPIVLTSAKLAVEEICKDLPPSL